MVPAWLQGHLGHGALALALQLGLYALTPRALGFGLGFTLSRLGLARRGPWFEVGVKPETRTPTRKESSPRPKSKTLTVKAPKRESWKEQLQLATRWPVQTADNLQTTKVKG